MSGVTLQQQLKGVVDQLQASAALAGPTPIVAPATDNATPRHRRVTLILIPLQLAPATVRRVAHARRSSTARTYGSRAATRGSAAKRDLVLDLRCRTPPPVRPGIDYAMSRSLVMRTTDHAASQIIPAARE
jgi:hypothetical protein